MYNWRKMSDEMKKDVLKRRKEQHLPFHSLSHKVTSSDYFHLSAACYEHKAIIGNTFSRIENFEKIVLSTITNINIPICAYCILPNHYHALVKTDDIKFLLKKLFSMHRRPAIEWNKEEKLTGRKIYG